MVGVTETAICKLIGLESSCSPFLDSGNQFSTDKVFESNKVCSGIDTWPRPLLVLFRVQEDRDLSSKTKSPVALHWKEVICLHWDSEVISTSFASISGQLSLYNRTYRVTLWFSGMFLIPTTSKSTCKMIDHRYSYEFLSVSNSVSPSKICISQKLHVGIKILKHHRKISLGFFKTNLHNLYWSQIVVFIRLKQRFAYTIRVLWWKRSTGHGWRCVSFVHSPSSPVALAVRVFPLSCGFCKSNVEFLTLASVRIHVIMFQHFAKQI